MSGKREGNRKGRAPIMADPASDPPPPDPETVACARGLLFGAARAVLSTGLAQAAGHPYGSLVLCATTAQGAPLLLLSDLAEHTRNLAADSRAGLLLDGTADLADPLAGPRLSLIGHIGPCAAGASAELACYLARHPQAAVYAGFKDFNLYRMTITRAHLVAGFGRVHWLDGRDFIPG